MEFTQLPTQFNKLISNENCACTECKTLTKLMRFIIPNLSPEGKALLTKLASE